MSGHGVTRTREISRMTIPGAAGTSTPVIQPQGGELFRGFSALGNRVRALFISFPKLGHPDQ